MEASGHSQTYCIVEPFFVTGILPTPEVELEDADEALSCPDDQKLLTFSGARQPSVRLDKWVAGCQFVAPNTRTIY